MLPRSLKLIFTFTAFAIFANAQTTTRPALSYSTFLSASGRVDINASAIDANGYQYVTGFTTATDFPTTPGAYNRTPAKDDFSDTGYHTMFVAKFNRTGTALIYSTFIAGASGTGIAVDSAGNAYVVGLPTTPEQSIPTTSGAWRPTCVSSSAQCSFLVKLNSAGSALVYSTFLIGKDCGLDTVQNANEGILFSSVALDNMQHAYVLGLGGPGCYTTDTAYKRTISSGTNLIVMKLKSDASGVLYSTYVGGNTSPSEPSDRPMGIAVDSQNHAVITGTTTSIDFPTTTGAFQHTQHGGETGDAFIAKLNYDGSKLLASTLLGGTGSDVASGIAIDSDNQIYVAGWTASTDFPVTAGAVEKTADPGNCSFEENVPVRCTNAFATKLPTDLSKLVYSTYLGGADGDEGSVRIGVDAVGHAYVTGFSTSTQVPLVKPTNTTGQMFLSELNIMGSAFQFSTRYGPIINSGVITPSGIGVDPAGNAYVAGSLFEAFVQTTPGAFQSFPLDSRSAFAAKWDIPPCTLSSTNRTVTICTPLANSTVPKKMLVAAGATDSVKVSAMRVYIDGVAVFTVFAAHFNTYVTLSSGTHRMTITAWDSSGPFSKTINVTVP